MIPWLLCRLGLHALVRVRHSYPKKRVCRNCQLDSRETRSALRRVSCGVGLHRLIEVQHGAALEIHCAYCNWKRFLR